MFSMFPTEGSFGQGIHFWENPGKKLESEIKKEIKC